MKNNKSSLPSAVQLVIKKIRDNDGEAYLVGGCVRDMILMKNPGDYDIATNLRLDKLKEVFPKAVIVGKQFSVIKVAHDIDIATYRIDGPYSDGRHPDTVMFVDDIIQDLSRRDFTMNAMAFDLERYVDPFNGMDAIRRGVIQTVNSAKVRFKEDSLRMLRAFRFSSLLGFNIANSTYKAIREMRKLISKVSKERIRDELMRMLEGENILGTLFSMSACGLLYEVLPDLRTCKGFVQNKYHKYDVLEHSFRVVAAVPKEKPLLRMAALLHDIGKPPTCKDYGKPHASFHNHEFASADMSKTILHELKFSNNEIDYITTMVGAHMFGYREEMKDSAIRRLLRRIGKENVADLMLIKYADRVGNGLKEVTEFKWDTRLKQRIDKIFSEEHALKISLLEINGKDLMKIGVEEGPFLGKILRACLDYVIEYPEKNTKKDLIQLTNELIEKYNSEEDGVIHEEEVKPKEEDGESKA